MVVEEHYWRACCSDNVLCDRRKMPVVKKNFFAFEYRKVNGSFLKESLEARSLAAIPGGTLLCISSATRVKGEYGEFALANFSAVISGKKEIGRVKIPSSVLENTSMSPPCFLLYKGMRPTKAGRMCHSASAYAPEGLTVEKLSFAALAALV